MPVDAATPLSCPACGLGVPPEPALRGGDRLHGVPGTFEVRVCAECGTGVTGPYVTSADLGQLYPEAYGAYALPSSPVARRLATGLFRARYRRALGRLPLRALRERPPGRLLDVGSGRGDLGVIARELGWEVTGLEPSAAAAEAARERGVATEVGTLETAPDRLSPPYDVVVFQHSLEHVVDPAGDLAHAHALLRPRGAVLVTVPNFGSWQARRFRSAWFHLDLPRHRSHFTERGLRALLRRTGFDQPAIGTSASADGLPMSLEYRVVGRGARSGAGRYAEIAGVLALTPVTAAANRMAGEGDLLHAVAERP